MLEIEEDKKIRATWAKALAQSDGNKDKAESIYIKLRVNAIKQEKKENEAFQENSYKYKSDIDYKTKKSRTNLFMRFVSGKIALWKVFWIYMVGLNVILFACIYFVSVAIDNYTIQNIILVVFFMIEIIISIALWNSSTYYFGIIYWAYLGKIVAIFVIPASIKLMYVSLSDLF